MRQVLGTLASTNHIEYLTKRMEDLIAPSKDEDEFDLNIDVQGPTLDNWDSGVEHMTNYSLAKIWSLININIGEDELSGLASHYDSTRLNDTWTP